MLVTSLERRRSCRCLPWGGWCIAELACSWPRWCVVVGVVLPSLGAASVVQGSRVACGADGAGCRRVVSWNFKLEGMLCCGHCAGLVLARRGRRLCCLSACGAVVLVPRRGILPPSRRHGVSPPGDPTRRGRVEHHTAWYGRRRHAGDIVLPPVLWHGAGAALLLCCGPVWRCRCRAALC